MPPTGPPAGPPTGSPTDPPQGASNMFEMLRDLEAEGYTTDMVPEDGAVRCRACDETSSPAEFQATGLRRGEGASDPDDMVAVVGLTCPRCGARGVFVGHYGAEASPEDADVLRRLDTRGESGGHG